MSKVERELHWVPPWFETGSNRVTAAGRYGRRARAHQLTRYLTQRARCALAAQVVKG